MSDFESGKGKLLDEHTLHFVRLLPGPIECVWAYLTEPEKRARWFAGGPMDLVPGGAVTFDHNHDQITDSPGPAPEKYKGMESGVVTRATVRQAEAPKLLVFDWYEEDETASEVTIELEPEGDHVRLSLTHRRIPLEVRVGVAAGWHGHLDILGDAMAGRKRRPYWSRHMDLEEWYGRQIT